MVLVFAFGNASPVLSQGKGTLRGIVSDSTNGEPLAFGNIYIKELSTGSSTDARGYYVITSIPAGKEYTAVFSFMGFTSKEIRFIIEAGRITQLDVELSSTSIEIGTIQKVADYVIEKNETNIGLQRITIKELTSLPKGVETDVLRSLQYMPGVQTTGDVSAKFYVRGGASNQNLVLLGGIPIYNPFHALGLFSTIDPDLVNSVEFYKGGFTAEYGGRLSSVININTKDGNRNRLSGKISSSFLTAKALIEGPIPNGSFIISGRKSYSSDILKKFLNNSNVPTEFYDLGFNINYANPLIVEGGKISIQGFFSGDNILNASQYTEDYKLKNNIFGFKWFQVGDVPLFFEVGLSISNFNAELIPKMSNVRSKKNDLTDVGLELDFNYIFDSKDEIALGFHIHDITSKLFLENSLGKIIDIGGKGTTISFYAKYKFMRYENLGIDIGSRINLTRLSGSESAKNMFEPRISFTYRIHPQIAIKGATGIYQQEITTLSDDSELLTVFEPWLITPGYIEPSRGIHYIAGIDYDINENLMISTESYYKKIYALPLLNEDKLFPHDYDFVSGKGESYGIEFLIKFQTDLINFTISYTRSYAYKIYNGRRFYPKYDQRNSGNVLADINLGKGWRISGIWNYNSGLPFTHRTGFSDYISYENYFEPWFYSYQITSDPLFATKNLGRLPDYHRLDLSISKEFSFAYFKIITDVSVINVYDRENIFYFKTDTGERVNMLPMIPTATIKIEI